MKKILFIFLFCSVLFNANAQNVQHRVHLEDGGIDIMTKFEGLYQYNPEKSVLYALQYSMAPNQEGYYFLNITLYLPYDDQRYIPEGSRLLIKTKTSHVITLTKCGNIKKYNHFWGSLSELGGHDSEWVRDTHVQRLSARYPIAEEDLQRILNESIVKLRFETTGDQLDFEYDGKKADETAEVLKKLHGILYRELNLYHGMK